MSGDAIPSALSSVAAAVGHPVSLLHVAACESVGRVGEVTALPLPSGADGTAGQTESTARTSTVETVFERLWTCCKLGETTDASRRAEAAADALGKCCRGGAVLSPAGVEQQGAREGHSRRVRRTLEVLFEMAKNQVRTTRGPKRQGRGVGGAGGVILLRGKRGSST